MVWGEDPYFVPTNYCLAIKPGYIDFPPRCSQKMGHYLKHKAHTGISNEFIEWEDEDGS